MGLRLKYWITNIYHTNKHLTRLIPGLLIGNGYSAPSLIGFSQTFPPRLFSSQFRSFD